MSRLQKVARRSAISLVVAAFCALPCVAMAADINFAGFASMVYGKTITDDDKEGELYEMSNDGEYSDMNLLGLRMDSNLRDDLSVTVQAVAYGKNDYDPEFDWAYATIELDPEWRLSVGRTRIPLFMYSSFQDVGFAYPWIKPPFAVYGVPQFKSVDGAQLQYRTNLGQWVSNIQGWIGNTEERLQENNLDSDLIMDRNMGAAWTLERDWLTLRAVYMQADSSIDLTSNPDLAALDGLMQMMIGYVYDPNIGKIPNASAQSALIDLREQINWEDNPAKYYGLGASVDFGVFFATLEGSYIDIEDPTIAAPETLESYYLMLGTRPIQDWTFTLTISGDRDREHEQLIENYDALMTPLIANMLSSSDAQTQYIGSQTPTGDEFAATALNLQRYDTLGYTLTARWDFHRSAAVKFEFLDKMREYGGDGNKVRPQAFRVGLDLVF